MDDSGRNTNVEALVAPLFESMKVRVTDEELQRIKDAFAFAREAHKKQRRKSGEPYIVHPISVARIVGEEMMLDANTVCAAFLHDVVEDTSYTLDDIEQRFGDDVAFLVRVVTKKKKDHYEKSKQVDNFKQMIDSVKFDIRAMLIKLADRLHNMRTLSSMRPEKQMKIAGETDYFYAPLANRLGLFGVKIELENLSFKYRCPREYAEIEKMIEADKCAEKEALERFTGRISSKLETAGFKAKIDAEFRMPLSLRRKMIRTGRDFGHIENRHFVRIVFDDGQGSSEKDMSLKIYSLLTDMFKEKPGELSNYIDAPKENGYQALHVKLLSDTGAWEEVHICSHRMLLTSWYGYIAEREDGNSRRWIEKLKSILQDMACHSHEIDFMEGISTSFYNDDITVFTPKGRPVTLPQRSTALDFAFEIHSSIGHHAKYARINGKLCSVKTLLNRGDSVEIGTDNAMQPKHDWVDFVHTYKAKRYLKSFFLKKGRHAMKRCEFCNPLPGDEVIGFRESDGTLYVHKRDCAHVISQVSQNGDSVEAVEFEESFDMLYPVKIHVKAVDRFHLLCDLIDCITNQLHLSIISLNTVTVDEIVDCDICFSVHSFDELQTVMTRIGSIQSVDEVSKPDR